MLKKKVFLLLCLLVSGLSLTAQFNYQAINAQVLQGTYTGIDSLGTVINTSYSGSPIEYDDTVSSAYNIGFSFVYNSSTFTKFVLSTNGFIRLGTIAPDAINYDYINSSDVNILAPFNMDLEGNITPQYRVYKIGRAHV